MPAANTAKNSMEAKNDLKDELTAAIEEETGGEIYNPEELDKIGEVIDLVAEKAVRQSLGKPARAVEKTGDEKNKPKPNPAENFADDALNNDTPENLPTLPGLPKNNNQGQPASSQNSAKPSSTQPTSQSPAQNSNKQNDNGNGADRNPEDNKNQGDKNTDKTKNPEDGEEETKNPEDNKEKGEEGQKDKNGQPEGKKSDEEKNQAGQPAEKGYEKPDDYQPQGQMKQLDRSQKGGLTQNINALRNRKELKEIENNVKSASQKIKKDIQPKLKKINRELRPIKIKIAELKLKRFLQKLIIVILFLSFAGIIAIKFKYDKVKQISKEIETLESRTKVLKENKKQLEEDKKQEQIRIANEEHKRRNILNRSLLGSNSKQRQEEEQNNQDVGI